MFCNIRVSLIGLLSLVFPLTLFGWIWLPVYSQHHIPNVRISPDTIAESVVSPADSILELLDAFQFWIGPKGEGVDFVLTAADKAVRGDSRFVPSDLEKGTPSTKLSIAGLYLPRLLLDAYEITHEEKYFERAKRILLDFIAFRQETILPRGYLLNSHAVPAQAAVIARFWKLYRKHSGFAQDEAGQILAFAATTGLWLLKSEPFVYATNHGVMQNLALWHLSLAFPKLQLADQFKEVARSRLAEQMQYYVNSEGVILEHSPGYQFDGVTLLAVAFQYMTLLQIPIPWDWRMRYEKAIDYCAQLQRPNRTLPKIGDTEGLLDSSGPLILEVNSAGSFGQLRHVELKKPNLAFALYPIAGYAIFWNGLDHWGDRQWLNQTAVTWSYYPGHAHKLPDELSVNLWAAGHNWLTSMGYAAYETPERAIAESWDGSNAPHLTSETSYSQRESSLEFSGYSERIFALDISREGPGMYRARRQILNIRPDIWIILDNFEGDDTSRTVTQWTVSRDVDVHSVPDGLSYLLASKDSSSKMQAFFRTSPGATLTQLRGSKVPFGGWEIDRMTPQPTWALRIVQPAKDSWAAAVWLLRDSVCNLSSETSNALMRFWNDAADWEMNLAGFPLIGAVGRRGDTIYLRYDKDTNSDFNMILQKGENISQARAFLTTSLAKTAAKYSRGSNQEWAVGSDQLVLVEPRTKVTLLLLAVLLIQESCLALLKRFHVFGQRLLRATALTFWFVGGIWLLFSYLA